LYRIPQDTDLFDAITANVKRGTASLLDLSMYYPNIDLINRNCDNSVNDGIATDSSPLCKEEGAPTKSASSLTCISESKLGPIIDANKHSKAEAVYDWDILAQSSSYTVINGVVLDFSAFLDNPASASSTNEVDVLLRKIFNKRETNPWILDATRDFLSTPLLRSSIDCLTAKYQVGFVKKEDTRCFFSDFLFQLMLIIILMIIFVKFFMALVFLWFLSGKLSSPPPPGKGIMYQPAHNPPPTRPIPPHPEDSLLMGAPLSVPKGSNRELYTVMLVTCYSEGEEGLRCTLDSLAATSFSDQKKLLFVVCDGIVQGSGNPLPTPDILLAMIKEDKAWGEPEPFSYIAVAGGSKRHNMARVHIGFYS
jgi:chitin synthase